MRRCSHLLRQAESFPGLQEAGHQSQGQASNSVVSKNYYVRSNVVVRTGSHVASTAVRIKSTQLL